MPRGTGILPVRVSPNAQGRWYKLVGSEKHPFSGELVSKPVGEEGGERRAGGSKRPKRSPGAS